ncbi:hypothetical protein LSAT2_020966 [Lamellibrachia satsuma]|nr:hypothetical protein LSAT2_020966 [Lamellibrachia satsuma]
MNQRTRSTPLRKLRRNDKTCIICRRDESQNAIAINSPMNGNKSMLLPRTNHNVMSSRRVRRRWTSPSHVLRTGLRVRLKMGKSHSKQTAAASNSRQSPEGECLVVHAALQQEKTDSVGDHMYPLMFAEAHFNMMDGIC